MPWYRTAFEFVKEVAEEVSDDDVPSMSGAIAYFAILSLPPLLVMLVWLAGVVFPDHVIESMIAGEAGGVLGDDTAAQLGTMLQQARDIGGTSVIAQSIGIGALVLSATGAFIQLQRALNRAWDVVPDPDRSGIKVTLMKRLTSFGMILVIAFLMGVSLVLSALLSVFATELSGLIGGAGWVFIQVADVVLPLALFTLLFAAIYRVLPDAQVPWRVVWVGAFVTSVLFVAGKMAISAIMGQANVGDAFGAAGSLVVILVWIYYSSLLLLVGAEFTQVWARRRGMKIRPDEGAMRVVSDVRVEERHDDAGQTTEPPTSENGDGEESGEVPGDQAHHPYAQRRAPRPRSGVYSEPGSE